MSKDVAYARNTESGYKISTKENQLLKAFPGSPNP